METTRGMLELVPCIVCGEPGIDGQSCPNPDCMLAAPASVYCHGCGQRGAHDECADCARPSCCCACPAAVPVAPVAMNAIDRWISRDPVRAFRAVVTMGIVGVVGVLALLAGPALIDAATVERDDFGIPYTQAQVDAFAAVEREQYGSVLFADSPDAAVLADPAGVAGDAMIPVQLAFIPCIDDPNARWFEDGTTIHGTCAAVEPWQTARIAAVAEHIANLDR